MPLSPRENYLRTVRFQGPEYIPITIGIPPATWYDLRGELEDVLVRHPTLFPNFRRGQVDYNRPPKTETDLDSWGCTVEYALDGLAGMFTGHPLADWDALDTFVPPDPACRDDLRVIDWAARRERLKRNRQAGELVVGSMPHGHFYLRLTYLRGTENFLMDVATEDPRLDRLIAMVEAFNRGQVERLLDIGVDVMKFADDLGSQNSTLLSPAQFRRYIGPTYSRLARMCKERGTHTYLHTDGYIMGIADQLLDWPIDVINCQDLVNGVDELAKTLKGKACIDLDVDRQKIIPFGTPAEIAELIECEVRTLGSKAGGLCLTVGFYPPTPPENIEAVLSAFDRFRNYWWA